MDQIISTEVGYTLLSVKKILLGDEEYLPFQKESNHLIQIKRFHLLNSLNCFLVIHQECVELGLCRAWLV